MTNKLKKPKDEDDEEDNEDEDDYSEDVFDEDGNPMPNKILIGDGNDE